MKFFKWLLAIGISALVLLLLLSKFSLNQFLSHSLSNYLGVNVSINSVQVRPSKITFRLCVIDNPPQYRKLPFAFSAKEITIQAPILNYFRQRIIIDQITIDHVILGLEFDSADSTTGNWTALLGKTAHSKEPSTPSKNQTSILVNRVLIRNIQTQLVFQKEGSSIKTLPPIPQIVLTNLSTSGSFPSDQLTQSVLGQMLKEVFITQKLKNMLQNLILDPKGTIDEALKPLRQFFGYRHKPLSENRSYATDSI